MTASRARSLSVAALIALVVATLVSTASAGERLTVLVPQDGNLQYMAFWVAQGAYHGGALPALLTRLHVRYDSDHFPEDLAFQETGDQVNFQGRYVLNRAWKGDVSCSAGHAYVKALKVRRAEEATALAKLTGWELAKIHARMGPDPVVPQDTWWKTLWQK